MLPRRLLAGLVGLDRLRLLALQCLLHLPHRILLLPLARGFPLLLPCVVFRFALQALYGHGEGALIEGIRPINPLDVLDVVLIHRKAGAFILDTWTL